MKTSILTATLLALSAFVFTPSANAHGSTEPQHGGVVKVEHEMVFELVREQASTSLYLRDHGQPYPTAKITGTVTVLADGQKSDADFTSADNNKMTANISIPDGAKVLIKVQEDDHHSVTVRFAF